MKLFYTLLVIFGFVASIFALKHEICGQEFAKNTNEEGVSCRGMLTFYSYDKSTNECVEFAYGGCHGNDNRFAEKSDCEEKCKE